MRWLTFLITGLLSLSCFALETDNYLVWQKTLKDSSTYINQYFFENINQALEEIPDHGKVDCHNVTVLIAKRFTSRLVHDNPVENWLFSVLKENEIFPSNINYVGESIYREPYLFYIPWFGLAPNIQVNGYYFGTDKLSHFASTGMQYYKIYTQEIKKNKPARDAIKKAIHWGILDEKSVHGYLASGILSYADLESNYQGLKFYQNFCQGQGPYLRKDSTGQWRLAKKPDIKKYVNGYWDETFELSYRLPGNWENVKEVIKDNYCNLTLSDEVSARMNYYQASSSPSPSIVYLNSLKRMGKLPDPASSQSIQKLCIQ